MSIPHPVCRLYQYPDLWQITSGCSASPAKFCPNDPLPGAVGRLHHSLDVRQYLHLHHTPYFTDIPATDAFFPYIQKMRDLGITSGCTSTTFCPADPVTGGRFDPDRPRQNGGSLWRQVPLPTSPFFTDVNTGALEFPFIQKMAELGITSGCSATTFCPSDLATRQQIAVFLTRAFLN